MKITLMLFIPPNGRQEPMGIDINPDFYAKTQAIDELGMRFTMESHPFIQDTVSFCIEHPKYGDYAIEMIQLVDPNNPKNSHEENLARAIEKVLTKFDPHAAKRWLRGIPK